MRQRSLYASWRLTTVYRPDGTVVIISLAKRSESETLSVSLAKIFPGLSATGRRRSGHPAARSSSSFPFAHIGQRDRAITSGFLFRRSQS